MFQVVDPPHLPELPVAPNRRMLFMFAIALAVGFGLLTVLIVEIPRFFVFSDERDIEYYLGAPVLAMIPETLTRPERRRRRRIRWTRGLIFLLFAAVIIPALVILVNRAGIFQLLGYR